MKKLTKERFSGIFSEIVNPVIHSSIAALAGGIHTWRRMIRQLKDFSSLFLSDFKLFFRLTDYCQIVLDFLSCLLHLKNRIIMHMHSANKIDPTLSLSISHHHIPLLPSKKWTWEEAPSAAAAAAEKGKIQIKFQSHTIIFSLLSFYFSTTLHVLSPPRAHTSMHFLHLSFTILPTPRTL